jgi:transcriptional regulator with XRE-family HTH domain
MTITGAQVKAARQLLGWSQEDLADEAGLSTTAIAIFEADDGPPSVQTPHMIRLALEDAGVEFVEGEPGVKLKANP